MTGIAIKENHNIHVNEGNGKKSLGQRFLAYLNECMLFYGKMYSRPMVGKYEEVHYEK